VLLLLTVILNARWILGIKVENALAAQISGHIHDGAKAFLSSEYKVMFPWIVVLFIVLALLTVISQPLPSWQGLYSPLRRATLVCRSLHWQMYAPQKLLGEAVGCAFCCFFSWISHGHDRSCLRFTRAGACGFRFGGFEKAGGIVSSFSLGASFVALFARVGGAFLLKLLTLELT